MDVVILHGIGSSPGAHWQDWLAAQLRLQGHEVWTPVLPNPEKPDRSLWLRAVTNLLANRSDKNLVLVGHSLGAVTALDYVEQAGSMIRGLATVAGFGRDYGSELNSYFMADRTIDFDAVRKHVVNIACLYGDDDPYVPQEVLSQLAQDLNTAPVVFPGGGHLNTESGHTRLRELAELLTLWS